jgi:hypothetical protein
VKDVRPSALLVAVLAAAVVEMEGMAGIGSRPTAFQVIMLAAATVTACWLGWLDRRDGAEPERADTSTPLSSKKISTRTRDLWIDSRPRAVMPIPDCHRVA